MRALCYSVYGAPDDVSAVREVDAPDAGDGDVLVRTYSLDEASEAMAYLEQGHVPGEIAIAVSQPDG